MKTFLSFALIILSFLACKNDEVDTSDPSPVVNNIAPPANISYNIVGTYPHDTASYTQGLFWQNNKLYEGTGLEGQSRLMIVDLKNGKPTQQN
jgi:glutamine cyclotransferase